MKKLQIISPKAYCPTRKVPFDKNDIIYQIVNQEDILNHRFTPMEIPKLSYPNQELKGVSLKALFAQILP